MSTAAITGTGSALVPGNYETEHKRQPPAGGDGAAAAATTGEPPAATLVSRGGFFAEHKGRFDTIATVMKAALLWLEPPATSIGFDTGSGIFFVAPGKLQSLWKTIYNKTGYCVALEQTAPFLKACLAAMCVVTQPHRHPCAKVVLEHLRRSVLAQHHDNRQRSAKSTLDALCAMVVKLRQALNGVVDDARYLTVEQSAAYASWRAADEPSEAAPRQGAPAPEVAFRKFQVKVGLDQPTVERVSKLFEEILAGVEVRHGEWFDAYEKQVVDAYQEELMSQYHLIGEPLAHAQAQHKASQPVAERFTVSIPQTAQCLINSAHSYIDAKLLVGKV